MKVRNPFVRNIPCPTCQKRVPVKPLGLWGHEIIRCPACQSPARVRYRVPSFVLTFVVLTLIYGVVWIVPWEGKTVGLVCLGLLVAMAPIVITWVLGEFIVLEKAPEEDSNRREAG